MLAELPTLLELQEKDRAIQTVQGELEAFDPELEELDGAHSVTDRRVWDAACRGIDEAGGRRQQLEAKIEGFRLAQERRRQRLEWVRGAKEAANLMAGLDLGRTVLAREETEWIRSADSLQEAEVQVADTER